MVEGSLAQIPQLSTSSSHSLADTNVANDTKRAESRVTERIRFALPFHRFSEEEYDYADSHWPNMLGLVRDREDPRSFIIVRVLDIRLADQTCVAKDADPEVRQSDLPTRILPLGRVYLLQFRDFSRGISQESLSTVERVLALWRLPADNGRPAAWTTAYYPAQSLSWLQNQQVEAHRKVVSHVKRRRCESVYSRYVNESENFGTRVRFEYGDEGAGSRGRRVPLRIKIPGVGTVPGIIRIPVETKQSVPQNESVTFPSVEKVWRKFLTETKKYKLHMGAGIAVFWPKDSRFYKGRICKKDPRGWVIEYGPGDKRFHKFSGSTWRYYIEPTRKYLSKNIMKSSNRKRPRTKCRALSDILKRPSPKHLHDLGLQVCEQFLPPDQLRSLEKVCRELLDTSYSTSGPPASRTRGSASGAGVSNCIGQAEGCANGLQLYVTRQGGCPLWNRDSIVPERWVETVKKSQSFLKSIASTPLPPECKPTDRREDAVKPPGNVPRSQGFQRPTGGILSIRFCNRVVSGDNCVHCRQPAAKPTEEQWAVLKGVAKRVVNLGLIPSHRTIDGIHCRGKLLAFTVLDYGYHKKLKKATPGIPLHQDTSCLGEAIGSLHIAGDTKNIDLLFDDVPLNGLAAGRVISFAHKANSFYVMKDQSRWLARHRVQTTKSLGLLLRVKWVPESEVHTVSNRNTDEKTSISRGRLQRLVERYRKQRNIVSAHEEDQDMWLPEQGEDV